MTYQEFNTFLVSRQLTWVTSDGVELARRQENMCQVLLYYMPDNFFVEVHRDTRTQEVIKVRSFKHPALLERYVSHLKLPE